MERRQASVHHGDNGILGAAAELARDGPGFSDELGGGLSIGGNCTLSYVRTTPRARINPQILLRRLIYLRYNWDRPLGGGPSPLLNFCVDQCEMAEKD